MKLDKKPNCTLCKNKVTDNVFRFLPDLDKEGNEKGSGRLVHSVCHTYSRKAEMKELFLKRKVERIKIRKEAEAKAKGDVTVTPNTLKVDLSQN